MGELTHMFQQGGPMMYAILMLWLFVPIAALAAGGASAFRVWVPAVAWLLMPGLVSMVGALGWALGQTQTIRAVGAASVEMKDALLYAGMGISMYTEWFALFAASVALLGSAMCAAVGNAIGAGKEEVRWTLGGAGVAFVLAFLVAAATVALGFVRRDPTVFSLTFAVVLAGGALVVVGLRRGEGDADARRCAAARFHVALLGVLGVVSLAGGLAIYGRSVAFRAISNAAPESLLTLLWAALQQADVAVGGGIIAGIGILLASLPVVGPSLRHLGGARGIIGGTLASMILVIALALPGVGFWQQGRIVAMTGPMRALAVSDRSNQLPAPGAYDLGIGPSTRSCSTRTAYGPGWTSRTWPTHPPSSSIPPARCTRCAPASAPAT